LREWCGGLFWYYAFVVVILIVGIVAIVYAIIEKSKSMAWAGVVVILIFIFTRILDNQIVELITNPETTPYQTVTNDREPTLSDYNNYPKYNDTPDYQTRPIEYILLGTWQGEYTAGQGRTSLQLVITDYRNGIISAYFYFSAHPENPNVPSGVYSMRGSISEDMTISLIGQEWVIRPGNFNFIDIIGTVDLDNMLISSNEASLSVNKVSNDTELRHNIIVPSSEGYLTSIAPWRLDGVNGFMINNDVSTLRGRGFSQEFIATSATNSYHQVISVNNISPFEIVYNLQGNYSIISGRVAFDDRTPSGNDGFQGVGASSFIGSATVTFLSGDYVLENGTIEISTTGLPQPFELNVEGVYVFTIRFDFPWWNWVFENFTKYFNLIDVMIE